MAFYTFKNDDDLELFEEHDAQFNKIGVTADGKEKKVTIEFEVTSDVRFHECFNHPIPNHRWSDDTHTAVISLSQEQLGLLVKHYSKRLTGEGKSNLPVDHNQLNSLISALEESLTLSKHFFGAAKKAPSELTAINRNKLKTPKLG